MTPEVCDVMVIVLELLATVPIKVQTEELLFWVVAASATLDGAVVVLDMSLPNGTDVVVDAPAGGDADPEVGETSSSSVVFGTAVLLC